MNDDRYHINRSLLYKNLAIAAGIKIVGDKFDKEFSGVFNIELPHYEQKFNASHLPVPGGTYNVHVNASPAKVNGRKTIKHRIVVECRCGKLVPFGRLHQHMHACPKKS